MVGILIKNCEFDKAEEMLDKHFPKPMAGKVSTLTKTACSKFQALKNPLTCFILVTPFKFNHGDWIWIKIIHVATQSLVILLRCWAMYVWPCGLLLRLFTYLLTSVAAVFWQIFNCLLMFVYSLSSLWSLTMCSGYSALCEAIRRNSGQNWKSCCHRLI